MLKVPYLAGNVWGLLSGLLNSRKARPRCRTRVSLTTLHSCSRGLIEYPSFGKHRAGVNFAHHHPFPAAPRPGPLIFRRPSEERAVESNEDVGRAFGLIACPPTLSATETLLIHRATHSFVSSDISLPPPLRDPRSSIPLGKRCIARLLLLRCPGNEDILIVI